MSVQLIARWKAFWLHREEKKRQQFFRLVRPQYVAQRVDQHKEYGEGFCFDVGAGKSDSAGFLTVDVDPASEPTYVGDIRCLFAADPQYRADLVQYPDLQKILPGQFMLVRMAHVVEHVEWIYQTQLFQWVYDLLAPGGIVVIYTPNFEFVAGMYVENRKLQRKGVQCRYPVEEHDGLRLDRAADMQSWVNFKINSGCSRGDYHLCMHDSFSLAFAMDEVGFVNIAVSDEETLSAVAYKAEEGEEPTVQTAIARALVKGGEADG